MRLYIFCIFTFIFLTCKLSFSQDSIRFVNYETILDKHPDKNFYDTLIIIKTQYYQTILSKLEHNFDLFIQDMPDSPSSQLAEKIKKECDDLQDTIWKFADFAFNKLEIYSDSVYSIIKTETLEEIKRYSIEKNVYILNTKSVIYGDTTKFSDITDLIIDRLNSRCNEK